MAWFGVRCIFKIDLVYEERIVLFDAHDMDGALDRAEKEAIEYCEVIGDCVFLGLSQGFELSDRAIASGSEVFSLMRISELPPEAYLARFFETGDERQQVDHDELPPIP